MSTFQWADQQQAVERLQGTYLMYGDDPVYFREIGRSAFHIKNYRKGVEESVKPSDPAFHGFRKLPPLGWMNVRKGAAPYAVYLKRIPIRGRRHGLTNDSVSVQEVQGNTVIRSASLSFSHAIANPGYLDLVDRVYPSFEDTLEKTPKGSAVAFSRKLAIYKDYGGLSFLYRNAEQIGLISKASLYVFPETKFYVDELSEEGKIPLEIKEL